MILWELLKKPKIPKTNKNHYSFEFTAICITNDYSKYCTYN